MKTNETVVTATDRQVGQFYTWYAEQSYRHLKRKRKFARNADDDSEVWQVVGHTVLIAAHLLSSQRLDRLLRFLAYLGSRRRRKTPAALTSRLAALDTLRLIRLATEQIADALDHEPDHLAAMARSWFRGPRFKVQLALAEFGTQRASVHDDDTTLH